MLDPLFRIANGLLDRLCATKRPLLYAIIAVVAVHLLLMPFCVEYDINFWSYVTRNLRAGYGLYELDGYYYTPVWGYLISFMNEVETNLIPAFGVTAVRVFEALGVETISDTYFTTATIVSLSFAYLVKMPLMVSNIVMAYLVYWLIKDRTGSDRKAILGFCLTGFCPIILGTTCLTGMPDTFSATFLLLTIVFIRKDRMLLAGTSFAIAVLTKFFPIFVLPLIIVYVLRRKETGAFRDLTIAAAGVVLMSVIILLPAYLEGNLMSCFQFLTDRASAGIVVNVSAPLADVFSAGSDGGSSVLDAMISKSRVIAYAAVLLAGAVLAVKMYGIEPSKMDESFLKRCFLVLVLCMLYPPAPQYVVVMLPFLAYHLVVTDRRYSVSWLILAVSAFLFVPITNGLVLMTLAEWTPLLSVDTAMGIFDWYQNTVFGLTYMDVQYYTGGAIQYAGILAALAVYVTGSKWMKDRKS